MKSFDSLFDNIFKKMPQEKRQERYEILKKHIDAAKRENEYICPECEGSGLPCSHCIGFTAKKKS